MGEAKRRKQKDTNYGKSDWELKIKDLVPFDENFSEWHHEQVKQRPDIVNKGFVIPGFLKNGDKTIIILAFPHVNKQKEIMIGFLAMSDSPEGVKYWKQSEQKMRGEFAKKFQKLTKTLLVVIESKYQHSFLDMMGELITD